MVGWRGGLAAAAVAAAAAAACSGGDAVPVAGGRVMQVTPESVPEMGALTPASGTNPAPFTGLRGENWPWMFHQANVRDIGGGHSLLRDVLDAAFDKYLARARFPIVSPTMDDLAGRVRGRMGYDASGASATLGPGAQVVVRVSNAAAVPVTGLCTPAAESYGGQKISYLALAAGDSVTLSLADCNPSYTGGGDVQTGAGGVATQGGGLTAGDMGGGCSAARGGGVPSLLWTALGLAALALHLSSTRRPRR